MSEADTAAGVPADAKRQRGQPRADQREIGVTRCAPPVGASGVHRRREQHAEERAGRYCSYPIVHETTIGTSATSRNATPGGQLMPVGDR
jgi:hypothetical protein